jgi:hypothetical protein
LQEEIHEKALISSIFRDAKIKIYLKYGKPKWQRPYRVRGYDVSEGSGIGAKIMFKKVAIHDRNIRSRRS